MSSVLRYADFVGAGINTSVLNFTPVTNVCGTEVPFGACSDVSEMCLMGCAD